MIALLQRVTEASVRVEARTIAEIGSGLLVLLGVEKDDDRASAQRLLERVLNYRVFADQAGRMNLSLRELSADLLLVPQFTLVAQTERGNRPGFATAADPGLACELFDYVLDQARSLHVPGGRVAAGRFGAHMQVSLVNDGPVTFWLETSKKLQEP